MNYDKLFKGLATLVVVVVVVAVLGYLWQVLLYVLASAVFGIMGRPIVQRLIAVKLFGRNMSRTLAASLSLLIMWVVAGGLAALFMPLVFGKVHELATLDWDHVVSAIEVAMADLRSGVESIFSVDITDMGTSFKEFVLESIDVNFMSTFSSVTSFIVGAAIAAFSITFITFYFLKEDGLFYRLVALFFPDSYRANIYRALDSVTLLLTRYIRGLLLESGMLMVVISVVLMLLGMCVSDALIIGLIIGVMNVVPYAGPFIGSFVAICIGVITPIDGNIIHTVAVIASTIVCVKLIDDFIIQPTLYSERVMAHPLEIFLVILVAGRIGGIWGILLAIPLYTIMRVFAREFFSEYSLVRKLTSQMNSKL